MTISEEFQKRLKLLRTTYQLSHQDMTNLLNMKSRTNISNWELGKNIPSLDTLCDITSLFAIRTDWILGYVDYPYDNEIMLTIENQLLKTINNSIDITQWIPKEYKNPQMRTKIYSLDVRANIIYLLKMINISKNINPMWSLESNKIQKKLNIQNQQKIQLRTLLTAKKLAIPLYNLKENIQKTIFVIKKKGELM